jgi:hypothetical protein
MTNAASPYTDDMPEKARRYAENGATDREIADLFDVSERTLYRWKHTHPELADALCVGKGAADARVEQSLYRRATGYSFDAVKFHAVGGAVVETPYVEHVPPDTTAAIFWLKNRKPDAWRDKTETVVTVHDDLLKAIEEGNARVAGGSQA